jgi:hypothetical protein
MNSINPAAKVVITTIQRLYSMLKGETEFDAGNEEGSAFDTARPWQGEPPDVGYNAGIPPEFLRHKLTRAERLQRLDHDLTYAANQLDRDVVSESQIRTVLQQFRDKVLPEAFPGRSEVPKTLIFAKDDSHADDIVRIAR